ncbi:hypothetical protein FHS29_001493 [Saccharothrix tamanrassetensis]|uniref:Uncharacterized protein n=1 Tax=Saccharothrix tamanrassetensis TaxID=1051531 RepID=A0A841CD87_9PSEU|nr:hypothetical protein [Saccharothrix tamanrassetensis]
MGSKDPIQRCRHARTTNQPGDDCVTGLTGGRSAGWCDRAYDTSPRRKPWATGLGAVAHAELAEQPAGVGLDGVLRQVELAPDLPVALALAHPAQHLEFPLGELDARIGRLARSGHGGARQRVRERGHQFRARGVPAEIPAGTAGDRGGDAARVVRCAEHDDVCLRVGRDESPGRFDAGRDGALGSHQHHVHRLPGEASQQLVTVRYAVDAANPGDSRHHAGETLPHTAPVVANKDRGHGDSFLQPSDVPLPLSDARGRTLTRSGA